MKEAKMNKQANSTDAAHGDGPEKVKTTFVEQLIFIFIGTLPMLFIFAVCGHIAYKDYVAKHNNFINKSIFYGMIDPGSYFSNVTCAEVDHASKYCARYFTDFVINDMETTVLLKY